MPLLPYFVDYRLLMASYFHDACYAAAATPYAACCRHCRYAFSLELRYESVSMPLRQLRRHQLHDAALLHVTTLHYYYHVIVTATQLYWLLSVRHLRRDYYADVRYWFRHLRCRLIVITLIILR